MAIRAAALAARFALTIYMAALVPLAEIGTFGLVAAAAGIAPALFGFGLNYRVGRELVGLDVDRASRLIRDRMAFTLIVLLAAVAAAGGWGAATGISGMNLYPLIATILVLECLATDIQIALVSLRRPMAANLFLFVRSAAWIAPAIVAGLALPAARSAEVLFAFWAAGLVMSFALVALLSRDWPIRRNWSNPIDRSWLRQHLRAGRLIHLNDIAMAGLLFFERYMVDHFVDRRAAGLFYLAWSLANAAHALASAAIVQPALPRLVDLWQSTDRHSWYRALAADVGRSLALATSLAFVVAILILAAGGTIRASGGWPPAWLLIAMLAAAVLRLGADMLNYGLYAQRRDITLASINLGAFAVSILGSLCLIPALGLVGAAAMALAVPLSLAAARLVALLTPLSRPAVTPEAPSTP